jgi:DNA-binding MarR family transcriptional regulator
MGPRATAKPRTRGADGPAGVGAALYKVIAARVRWVPRDLSLTSLSTLSTLERSGPRRITDLAVVEGVTQPSMTVLVNGLVRSGLVERQGDPGDRRVALVALSANGKAFMRLRRRTGEVEIERLMEKLAPEEIAALTAAIPALEHLSELDQIQQDQLDRRLPT